MENYSYSSYPESGESSPRSREIDFENPPPWEDHQQHPPSNYRVKFMCSYGGKIHPRPHDNQLSYISGETKILAVDRNIKFAALISKLSSLAESDVSFKYQLPGEDLDALISVTNDDDLEHMMTEYDRLYRASPKPARLRLFLFSVDNPSGSFGSRDGKLDRERFVDALNSGPTQAAEAAAAAAVATTGSQSNVDFLFGLEKGNPHPHPPPPAKLRDPAGESAVPDPEMRVGMRGAGEDRVSSPDPQMIPVDIQRHIQDLQRLQLQQQDQAMFRRKNDENLVGVHPGGDYYIQKLPEKAPPPATAPAAVSAPAAYWPEKHIAGGGGSGGFPASGGGEQPVYMIPAPGGVYHAPIGRPVTGPAATQGYYQVQRMGSDVYREQQQQQQQQQQQPPPYNLFTSPPPVAAAPPHQQAKAAAYSEGVSMMRAVGGGGVGMGVAAAGEVGYAQVAYDSAGRQVYDSAGRQVYYTAPAGGVIPAPYPAAMAAVSAADLRVGPNGTLSPEGKIGTKVSQTSM